MRFDVILLALPLCAGGCFTAQYQAAKPLSTLLPINQTRVVIVPPADGADDRPETYKGSGEQSATALKGVLVERGLNADVGTMPTAKYVAGRYTASRAYCVKPTIELWSDRVTEWSGKPDQLRIRMLVIDQQSGATVDDRVIEATSKWWTMGGDHPQQMLHDLFARWADSVFEKQSTK